MSSTNISFFLFLFILFLRVHTLVINMSYSNEKLKGLNEFNPITNEYMNLNPWDNLSS